ncbi:serine hydrolase domain-containing protein [Paenarthrobacter sp. PH39-S1]|uniref:serine hydrolase domain-containing protein n=1 Tax=Paenarthrobacter sp. PH39-S1 TaxID=3046204 RepID=UPI0024BAA39D|nr:serine hydrolase domain-containing protein [Paenarthrobacter sp. PH39-S1]MDJ0356203.1 serine hydrolase domain-containing protein [Paenarthrobacter sp. PH39-S1]
MTKRARGFAAPMFDAVRDLMDYLLAADPRYSAQLAVYHEGAKVVDLHGGPDIAADSVTGVYSCSKGASALAFSLLVQDGLVDLDAAVTRYWPEFGSHGKDTLTVRQLLSHQAGVVGVPGGFRMDEYNDSAAVAARLADAVPYWRPGTAFGYHALTMGVLLEELCRRVTGGTLQALYEERIRDPFAVDMFLGLPEGQEPRFRNVLFDEDPRAPFVDPAGILGSSANMSAGNLLALPNMRSIRAAGSSSGAGVGSAVGLARLYAAASTGVDGGAPFLTPQTIAVMSQEQVWGADRVFSELGAFAVVFMKSHARMDFGSAQAFGHDGANGALGFADPAYGVGFGYVPQRVEEGGTAGRGMQLSIAVRKALLGLK